MVNSIDVVVPENTVIPPSVLQETESSERLSVKEEALAERYNRKNLFNQDLAFEFTRDKALLQQYYKVRETAYSSVWNLSHFSGAETEYDRKGHILVARMGNFCVGGLRIDISTPKRPQLLPVEIGSFRLKEYFPQLEHKQLTYGQVSGFALLPEFRGREITRGIMKRAGIKSAAMNIHMMFCSAPLPNTRLYREQLTSIGFEETVIHKDIILPEEPTTEGIRLYLMSGTTRCSTMRSNVDMPCADSSPFENI